jgi:hypothetical protein
MVIWKQSLADKDLKLALVVNEGENQRKLRVFSLILDGSEILKKLVSESEIGEVIALCIASNL